MLGAKHERATEKATYRSNLLSGAVVSVLVFLAGLGLGGFTGAALAKLSKALTGRRSPARAI